MTLCAICFKDRPGGAVNARTGEWECGRCNPAFSASQTGGRRNPGARGRA